MLIGGFGTRLRPLTCTRPKALFPIVNKPLLQWTFERLAKDGVEEAVLAVNGLTEFHIRQQNTPTAGLKLSFSQDPPKMPLGTAGPIKKAQELIGNDEPFLVLNGDLFTDINYKEIFENHKQGQSIATIALHEVEDPSRYGVAELSENNQIKRFIEKPPKGTAPTNFINAGVYVLSPEIFDYIPEGRAVSMEREVFPKLAEKGAFFGHKVEGLWIDIGKPEEYLQTNMMLLDKLSAKQAQSKGNGFEVKGPVAFDEGVTIGEGSIVGPYAVLGKNVSVGKNVQIKDSVVFADAQIQDGAVISGALIGESAVIGKNVQVSEGCIIADQAKIKDAVAFSEKYKVCPAKEVSEDTLKINTKQIC
ncbi:MAG: NDP-sugar synthase [Candidatus Bathyarchaeota archaeon]|nr:NDP-sugar synthase [Candidatus Bathyarchaeota archaeon]